MNGGFTKLCASIVTSSVWLESHSTRIVWLAMLAVADAEGVVHGSVPGFAHLARVTVEEMREAVERLSSRDPDSRTPAFEGRRIEAVEGGWRILNYRTYRERGQAKDGSRAPYMRDYRQRRVARNGAPQATVTRNTEAEAEAEARSQSTETGTRRGPLMGNYRQMTNNAHCSPACGNVPHFLHNEFVGKLTAVGVSEADAEARLRAFYGDTEAAVVAGGKPVGDDPLTFWRARFKEWQGTATPRTTKKPWPSLAEEVAQ